MRISDNRIKKKRNKDKISKNENNIIEQIPWQDYEFHLLPYNL